jgi:hypothetical protein
MKNNRLLVACAGGSLALATALLGIAGIAARFVQIMVDLLSDAARFVARAQRQGGMVPRLGGRQGRGHPAEFQSRIFENSLGPVHRLAHREALGLARHPTAEVERMNGRIGFRTAPPRTLWADRLRQCGLMKRGE